MAIELEFINFIVPIEVIKNKYPGGWDGCLKDHQHLINGRVWFDDHLFRDGAMGPGDIEVLVDTWKKMGFETIGEIDGEQHWIDCCVADQMFGPTLPCAWIETSQDHFSVYLKGTEPGPVIGRVVDR